MGSNMEEAVNREALVNMEQADFLQVVMLYSDRQLLLELGSLSCLFISTSAPLNVV